MQQSVMWPLLWCFVLQTSMDRCTQLVLHPLWNVQPVQLVVQEMAEYTRSYFCVSLTTVSLVTTCH